MALETEVKIRITQEDLDGVRARLTQLGARCLSPRSEEKNILFDFPDRNLETTGCAVRLRTYGDKTTLTFKGEIQEDPRFKKRQELETRVEDPQAMIKVLEGLGMHVCFEYSKIREVYTLAADQEQAEICLDETPVGTFVEIEGPEDTIESLASQLGWTPDSFIRSNYVEMYLEQQTTDRRPQTADN
jgi:adenylate cyclase class 2